MIFSIETNQDVYKFALSLYDKLVQTKNSELAYTLADIVDNCFASPKEALTAHLEAFINIREKAADLPEEYVETIDKAIELLR